MSCCFAQASCDRDGKRKRPPVKCKLYDARSKLLRQEGWDQELVMQKCGGMSEGERRPPPCSYLLSDQEQSMQINTVLGGVPLAHS